MGLWSFFVPCKSEIQSHWFFRLNYVPLTPLKSSKLELYHQEKKEWGESYKCWSMSWNKWSQNPNGSSHLSCMSEKDCYVYFSWPHKGLLWHLIGLHGVLAAAGGGGSCKWLHMLPTASVHRAIELCLWLPLSNFIQPQLVTAVEIPHAVGWRWHLRTSMKFITDA